MWYAHLGTLCTIWSISRTRVKDSQASREKARCGRQHHQPSWHKTTGRGSFPLPRLTLAAEVLVMRPVKHTLQADPNRLELPRGGRREDTATRQTLRVRETIMMPTVVLEFQSLCPIVTHAVRVELAALHCHDTEAPAPNGQFNRCLSLSCFQRNASRESAAQLCKAARFRSKPPTHRQLLQAGRPRDHSNDRRTRH